MGFVQSHHSKMNSFVVLSAILGATMAAPAAEADASILAGHGLGYAGHGLLGHGLGYAGHGVAAVAAAPVAAVAHAAPAATVAVAHAAPVAAVAHAAPVAAVAHAAPVA